MYHMWTPSLSGFVWILKLDKLGWLSADSVLYSLLLARGGASGQYPNIDRTVVIGNTAGQEVIEGPQTLREVNPSKKWNSETK